MPQNDHLARILALDFVVTARIWPLCRSVSGPAARLVV